MRKVNLKKISVYVCACTFHRHRKQIGCAEAMLCRAKRGGIIFQKCTPLDRKIFKGIINLAVFCILLAAFSTVQFLIAYSKHTVAIKAGQWEDFILRMRLEYYVFVVPRKPPSFLLLVVVVNAY